MRGDITCPFCRMTLNNNPTIIYPIGVSGFYCSNCKAWGLRPDNCKGVIAWSLSQEMLAILKKETEKRQQNNT